MRLRRFLVNSLQPRAPSGQVLCIQNLVALLTKADYLSQAPNTTFVSEQIDTGTTYYMQYTVANQKSIIISSSSNAIGPDIPRTSLRYLPHVFSMDHERFLG